MATLHGSWIDEGTQSYFFLWGEKWRSQASVENSAVTVGTPTHPYGMSYQELTDFLLSRKLALSKSSKSSANKQALIATLPSQNKKAELLPVLSGTMLTGTETLTRWKVEGFCFNSSEISSFLQALPLSSFQATDAYVGAELNFWSQIQRWSLDLIARSKFLPGIHLDTQGNQISCWQPLLDSSVDQARLENFAKIMPGACRAYRPIKTKDRDSSASQPEFPKPKELILDFLRSLIDARLRSWLTNNPPSKADSALEQWLNSLSQTSAKFEAEPTAGKRLETAITNWTYPVKDYLVTPASTEVEQNQFRVSLSLVPPTKGEINWGQLDWKLQYGLQAIDDPEFIIDAKYIWQHPVEQLSYQERIIKQPQETLLKGLGLASRLYPAIEASLDSKQPQFCQLNPIEVYQFIRATAWQLEDNGLGIILPPGLARGTSEKRLGVKIQAEVTQKKGERLGLQNLLKYRLELAMGDKTISSKEFEQMLAQKSPLVQVDGEWIALQPADVKAAETILASTNEQMNLSVEDALRFTQSNTGETIAKLPVVGFESTGVLQELITNLGENKAVELIATPEGFKGELRPYQIRGVSWLSFLERWSLGACLADDMGLGKTPQLIAFLLNLKQQAALNKPTLVVCPTSVLGNWEREVKKFAPNLSTVIHHGGGRKKGKTFAKQVKNTDLVLTSYPLVFRDEKTLSAIDWEGIVLDEAQNIKNPQAKQSQAARKLNAGFRIALTGTPVENRLSELWSIIDFLNPGYLGNQQFFKRRFAIPIEKYGDPESLSQLRSLVQPFILRRLKTDKDIIQDLPEKQEINVFCGLSEEQANIYQELVDNSLEEIAESEGIQRRGKILTLIMKLKQVCNHPAQYLKENKLGKAERSGKLLRLEEMLEEIIAEGSRALIFTQFSEWGKLLQPYLEAKLGVESLFLYGATRRQQREEMVERFQNDPQGPPIFILSLKAGGTGLNLTRANHVFHIDRWWNPAVENQATDRAFRIGQKQNVQVHKFICTGTLEERISETIESKKQLAEQTVDAGEQWLTELDTDQLRNLFLLDRDAVMDE
ncbi:MAG: DEAD/DEAH box helicase [Oscillatoria sp. PMC 1068.18]|nr:DEAD/DEAH box helicase [Oscillatoria sp. PMC 1076.18]MEC4988803.1 DEAD/DEAH box helicase [Oscillatoria sp. PMC 1068.18]